MLDILQTKGVELIDVVDMVVVVVVVVVRWA